MFTGLVQKTGRLQRLQRSGGGWRLDVACEGWGGELALGESIAVQGACLTVTHIDAGGFSSDLLDETLARTALAAIPAGGRLNLERALRLGDHLGGHFVSGHVDETGRVVNIRQHGRDFSLTVSCSRGLSRMTVMKGSIAIDGVSLTVTGLGDDSISVEIIPHTWRVTSLGDRREGDLVNLEGDLIGKHVARLLESQVDASAEVTGNVASGGGSVDEAMLRRAGFGD